MGSQPQQSTPDLKHAVFERIERENVCPRSRLFFQSRECVVWTLWLVTVLVGALAIAVSLFVVVHRRYALYEATHDNFLTFLVAVLPYLWVGTFLIMITFAVYNLRHTKRGYRYPLWVVAGSSVVLSFAGGSFLQFLGLGAAIDREFGERMVTYPSQQRMELALWQAPAEGRLVGAMRGPVGVATSTVWFTDSVGARWQVDISDFYPGDHEVLSTRERVRLIGIETTPAGSSTSTFHACGAFPWLYGRAGMDTDRFQAARLEFVRRIAERREHMEERMSAAMATSVATSGSAGGQGVPGSVTVATFAAPTEALGPCAKLPVLTRVERGGN